MNNILGIIVSFIFIGIVILSAKLVEKKGKEASRKYIHILLCNWWFIAMYFFKDAIWASLMPLIFIVINYISYQKGIIEVMERESNKEEGLGTVYYALTLFILSIVTFGIGKPIIGLVGVLVMGYADGLAAVIGKTVKSKEYQIGKQARKTLAGSATMFIVTFIIMAIFLYGLPFWYLKAIIASAIITVIEAISIKGTDNITVPLITSAIMYGLWLI